jgi:uncharacterized protein (DUF1499 family)
MEKSMISHCLGAVGFSIAMLSILGITVAGLGTRFHLFNFRIGLAVLSVSIIAGVAAFVISLVSIILIFVFKSNTCLVFGIIGLVIGIAMTGFTLAMLKNGKAVPVIHDITTDTSNPPAFVAIIPLRKDALNSYEYGGPEIAAKQEKAFPDIKPLVMDVSKDRAFEKSLAVAKQLGWEIAAAEKPEGRIEGTATTLLMGFKDDVVIRISDNGSGSRVDIRSESRVGKGDVGTNAKRIRSFLKKMKR